MRPYFLNKIFEKFKSAYPTGIQKNRTISPPTYIVSYVSLSDVIILFSKRKSQAKMINDIGIDMKEIIGYF
jgi:hypothetical protein